MPRSFRRASLRLTLAAAAIAASGCATDDPTGSNAAGSPASFAQSAATTSLIPGRYVVEMKGAIPGNFSAAVAAVGGTVERLQPQIKLVTVKGLSASGVASLAKNTAVKGLYQDMAIQWLPPDARDPGPAQQAVRTAGPVSQGTDQSGAFFYPFQWNIRQIQANNAWAATPGGLGARVCVLDTGVDSGQVDLTGKVDFALSAVPSEPFPEDLNFHGTFVSALISSNGFGIASVAPDARLCSIKVLSASGSGSFADLFTGILIAADSGVDAINMSLSGTVDLTILGAKDFVRFMQSAVDFARSKGVVVVASAGNQATNFDQFPNLRILPAQLKGVIAVSATAPRLQRNFDKLAEYSNTGLTLVDLAAPGGDLQPDGVLQDLIISACSRFVCGADGFYVFAAGTSFSSPETVGGAAVVESNFGGNQGNAFIENCLMKFADVVGPTFQYGRGRLNVLRAGICH